MPKPQKFTQFPKNHTDWNYNWGLLYIDVFSEAKTLQKMYRDERRFQEENLPATVYMSAGEDDDGHPVEYLLDTDYNRRPCPSLLPGRPEPKVGCKTSSEEKAEYKEIEAEHVNSLRKRFSDYCAAVDEKQAELALESPEGASFLRFFRDKANFALQNYGSEAINDSVYSNIGSQTATIHTPSGLESALGRDPRTQNFSFVMDQLSDMPFLPVFENATRMVSIACDHANAAKAGTLTLRQDRLARRLLLTQYDHVSGGVLESRRIVRDNNPAIAKDYKRWAGAMDNVPVHVSTNDRAPLYVPDNLEGRRIALRQGWPVQDAEMIGSLYEIQARVLRPSANNNRKYTTKLLNSMSELFDKIGSTRITDSTSRMDMLDQIESFLKENAKGLYLDEPSLNVVIQLRKAEKILPNQYLSDKELDEAAQEYERRKALPQAAGSDRSPTGYYEQAVAGTEVLSRLSAMYELMARSDSGRPDLKEYIALRNAVGSQIQAISGLYGPNPHEGNARAELMERLNAEHTRISGLAESYLSRVSKKEPAFKMAVAQELKSFCSRTARTAAATKKGMTAAEDRRRKLDWRIEKEQQKIAASQGVEIKPEENAVQESLSDGPGLNPSDARESQGIKAGAGEFSDQKSQLVEPTAEQLTERMDAFGRFTAELENAGLAKGADGPFDALRSSVQHLRDLASPLLTPQPDGSLPKLTQERRQELQTAYQLVSNVSKAFQDYAVDIPDPAYARALHAAAQIRSMAAEDLDILTGERGTNAETLEQLYSKRRLIADITGLRSENLGTPENPRITITVTQPGKAPAKGVFLPDRVLPEQARELGALRQRLRKTSYNADVAIEKFENNQQLRKDLLSRDEKSVRSMQTGERAARFSNQEYNRRYQRYLAQLSATSNVLLMQSEVNDVMNAEFNDALDSYLLSKAQIEDRNRLCAKMELKPGEPLAHRAGAMTAVAELLGVSSLVAATRPVTVIRDGVQATGFFAEDPQGTDCRNPADDDPILSAGGQLKLSAAGARDLAALQMLDFLCGSANRSLDNMSLRLRKTDNGVELNGVQAFDNSMSFMGCPMSRDIGGNRKLEDLKTVPKSLAERVMALSAEQLRGLLEEYRLPEQQIKRAAARLSVVQARIRDGMEYFRDKGPDELSDNRIRVVPDEEYNKLPETVLKDMPLRQMLDQAPAAAKKAKREQELMKLGEAFRQDERDLDSFLDRAAQANKNVYFGSREFETMRTALKAFSKAHSDLTREPLTEEEEKLGKSVHSPTEKELEAFKLSYQQLKTAVTAYKTRKETESQKKNGLDQKSLTRYQVADDLSKKLDAIWNRIEKLPENLGKIDRLYPVQKPASAKRVKQPGIKERLKPLMTDFAHQGGLYLDGEPRSMPRKDLSHKLYEAFALVQLSAALGPNASVSDDTKTAMVNLIKAGQDGKDKLDYGKRLDLLKKSMKNLPPDSQLPDPERCRQLCKAITETMDTMTNRTAEPVYLNRLTEFLKHPETIQTGLAEFTREAAAEALKQKNQVRREQPKEPTIQGRLTALNKLFAGQCLKRSMNNAALADKLLDAFAVVELGSALGRLDVELPDEDRKLMRGLLQADSPAALEAEKQKLRQKLPGVKLEALHTDSYRLMRSAINDTMNLSQRDPGNKCLKALTAMFRTPNKIQEQLPTLAEKLSKLVKGPQSGVQKSEGQQKNKRLKNKNNKHGNDPGLH